MKKKLQAPPNNHPFVKEGKWIKEDPETKCRRYPQFFNTKWGLLLALLLAVTSLHAQRHMEDLGRGVVAVRTSSSEVFVSWRMLGTDPADITFNLYRGETKLNSSPITESTNYTDNTSTDSVYPNPSSDEFIIKAEGALEYTIFDQVSRVMEQGKAENSVEVGANLSPGLYFINIQADGVEQQFKLIKK